MLKINVQFFAHKKGSGSTKNGRDSESKRLGVKRADGKFVRLATFWFAREVLTFIRVQVLASVLMTPCSQLWMVL